VPNPHQIPPVVDDRWLAGRRDEVVLADVRWYLDGRSGRDAWLAGHLPGAVWVDVDADLSAPPSVSGGRHPLPSPEQLAQRLGDLGIGNGDTVVAYDDAGGSIAARLVWMLRAIGEPAALLDGGLAGWSGALERGPVARPPRARTPVAWPAGRFLTRQEVADGDGDPGRVLLDARAAGRFDGSAPAPVDDRPGHVPGAHNAPWQGNLDERQRFLPPERLRERYADLGVGDASAVVAYCGSGVTACHDLVAIEHAGLGSGRLFTGSWSAWAADPALPAELGG
jgi:thiosulfate/3-mercaptopyruvate sulfurtransferase